jgi:uncharacterized protein (TIGR03382 family)
MSTVARALLACCALVSVARPAGADVLQQPGGAAIPSPMGCDGGQPTGLAAAFACVCEVPGTCNIGPPCPAPGQCTIPTGVCETTLWHEFNDNTCIPTHLAGLDPWQDGSLEPETFLPTCPLTFTLITRGTARFRDVFGWYNVTGARPTTDELYTMLDCQAGPGTSVVLDVRGDPRWRGGEIGFFIATPEAHGASGQCAGGDCCARTDRLGDGVGHVFYSQRAFNPDAAGADSYIHLVIYDSVIQERKFYFAWEDIFGGSNNDFTDLVTSVSGIECAGGGSACSTGLPGLCQYGVTMCRGGAVECVQVYDATEEVCDGADNDCDGQVDEGGVCSDDVTADCGSITCEDGLICRGGRCIDPCEHLQCGAGETCLSGVCLPGCNQCNGVACPASRPCDLDSGACVGAGGDGDGDGDGGAGGGAPTGGCCGAAGGPAGPAALAVLLGGLLARRRRVRPR